MTAKESLRKWVDALRSGQYAQGRGQLRNSHNEYCCLGVLAETLGYKAELTENWGRVYQYMFEEHSAQPYDSTLPPSLFRLLGLDEEASAKLIHMNDIDRYPFAKIADWVEENFLS